MGQESFGIIQSSNQALMQEESKGRIKEGDVEVSRPLLLLPVGSMSAMLLGSVVVTGARALVGVLLDGYKLPFKD